MNQRIRELAKEAKAHATHLDQIGVDASFEDIFNAKFAELIVIECAEIALREEHDPYECIKKHFGVEL